MFLDVTHRPLARVGATSTPRWTAHDTVRFKVEVDPEVEMIQQERLVSSLIWYHPS